MRVWFVKWTLWWLDNAKRVNFTFFSRIIVHKMRGCVEETVNFTGTGKVLTSITVCVQNRQHIVVRDLLVWINHSVSNLPPLERSAFNCRYITVRDTCVAGKCKGVRCHSYRCPRWLKLRHSILGPTGQRNTSILSRWQNWSPSIVNLPKRFDFSQLTLFFCRRCEPVIQGIVCRRDLLTKVPLYIGEVSNANTWMVHTPLHRPGKFLHMGQSLNWRNCC